MKQPCKGLRSTAPKVKPTPATANIADVIITKNNIVTDVITKNNIADDIITKNNIAGDIITKNNIADIITRNNIAGDIITKNNIAARYHNPSPQPIPIVPARYHNMPGLT